MASTVARMLPPHVVRKAGQKEDRTTTPAVGAVVVTVLVGAEHQQWWTKRDDARPADQKDRWAR